MMESLKETFPEKGEEESGWNFGKFHGVKHLLQLTISWVVSRSSVASRGSLGTVSL